MLAACAPAERDFGFAVEDLQAAAGEGGIVVHASHRADLSAEARRALEHGVPLRVRVDVTLRRQGHWADLAERTVHYEIRYLPLSDLYQLSGPFDAGGEAPGNGQVPMRTFPRLRHVLASLASIDLTLGGFNFEPGRYELSMRSRLDRRAMPGPMQLPVLLSPQWRHDSGWYSSEVELGRGQNS